MIYREALTGKEIIFEKDTPQAALQAFYLAFNSASLEKMEENWLQTAAASMSNPLGGIKRGWDEIRLVYERIFNGTAKVYVEFYDYSIYQSGQPFSSQSFCAVGRERGHIFTAGEKIDLAIRTSRIYQKHEDSWRQLHHHGSIENPDLLNRYQTLVTQK